MEENNTIIKELEEKIKDWQEELDTVWRDQNTDAAEVERRNLQNLINNAKQEIEKITQNRAEEEKLIDPKEFLDDIKKTLENTRKEKEDELKYLDKELKKIDMTLERLTEEQKMYEDQKNQSYKDIYEEYGTKIEEYKKKKEEMIKEREDVQKQLDELDIKSIIDDKLQAVQILTRGRMNLEEKIKRNERELRKKEIEVSEIFNSDKLTPEELKKKTTQLYKDIDKLKKQIKNDKDLMDEIQQYLNIIEGREDIQNSSDFNNGQKSEIMNFFHGQGDAYENVQRDENGEIVGSVDRDDRRGNDEYFGFEGQDVTEEKLRPGQDDLGHDDSGKDDPGHDDSGHDDPGHDDPGQDDPGHDDPGHDDPGHDDSGQDDPGHDDPGHDDPGHDDPGQDDPGHDDSGKDDPGTNPPPGQKNELVLSGLQIYRQQFNKMPEIKRRHTSSERLPFYQTALGIGGIAALSLANPIVGIPLIAATPFLKPIVRGITGQGKIENEIANQFRNLKNTNPAEFDRMVDYLSEEKIQDLKPNAVILNALHKVCIERAADQIEDLKAETKSLESIRNTLLSRDSNTLSDHDRHTLDYINNRLIEINEGHHETDKDGNEIFHEGLAQSIQRRYKELKRGKDRVSQKYRGNLSEKFDLFNIFAHRNSDSKTYRGPLNELADAELARDMMRLSGDNREAAAEQQKMDEVMSKNTHTNFLGVQNSVFNDRRIRKTGPVRIMSDQKDNTYRNAFTIASILGTLHAAHNIVNNAKVNVNGSKDLAQKAANGEQANIYAQGETAAIRANKYTEAPGYNMADKIANKLGDNAGVTIKSNKFSDQLRTISDQILKNKSSAQALQSASRKSVGVQYSVDHSQQIAAQSNMVENTEARAQILKNAADLIDKLEKNGSTITKNAFVGPIVAGIGAVQRVASSVVNNIKEARDNSKASGR